SDAALPDLPGLSARRVLAWEPRVRSPEIEEGKDEHPHEIDEVPVKACDLDDVVVVLAVVVTAQHLEGHDGQVQYANRHVQPVEARHHEEDRAELGRAEGIGPGPDPFRDEL